MSKRSIRRHHRARVIARAERLWERLLSGSGVEAEEIRGRARRTADNLAVCSCLGCCNVRRSKGWQGQPEDKGEILSELDLELEQILLRVRTR